MESKDHRTPLDSTCCLKTLLEEMVMRTVVRAVPKGYQGCQVWPVQREKKEKRASLV